MSITRQSSSRGPDRAVGLGVPRLISNLHAWWNTDEFMSTATDTAIGSWTDLSGNNVGLSQATTGNRPLLKQDIRAGKPILRFDGINDWFIGAAAAGNSLTLSVVCSIDVTHPGHIINNGDGENSVTIQYTGGITKFTLHSVQDINGPAYTTNTWVRLMGRCQPSGSGTNTYLINGAQVANYTGTPNNPTGALGIGNRSTGASYYSSVDIGEVLIYSKCLSDTEATTIDNYLSARWGF